MGSGLLLAVTGPAGAGKEAVLEGTRRYYADDRRIVFPRRILTSADQRAAELFCAVTPGQFQGLRREGAFSLSWDVGPVSYALPISVDRDIAAGRVAVVELDPCAVQLARQRYGAVRVVEVTASPQVRERRLSSRTAILPGSDDMSLPEDEVPSARIVNDGLPEAAVAHLVAVIEEELGRRSGRRSTAVPPRAGRLPRRVPGLPERSRY